jgi:cytochrome b subunit of formate dehydrogenase
MHAGERDVVGNFGVRGKGWVFWVAVVVIVLVAIGGIVTLALI